MRIILQRVKRGKVTVADQITGEIDEGLLLLVGFTHDDTEQDIDWMVEKVINLRIFEDEEGKMNRSLLDIKGSILSVSQFTLYGETQRGRRPSFTNAARPELAEQLYEQFNEGLRAQGVHVETGTFGAEMAVELVNDGPVTLTLDSDFRKGNHPNDG